MDWNTSYFKFIEKHAVRSSSCDSIQKHHVIPKSRLGKKGENLVKLTAVDHLVAHLILIISDFQNNFSQMDWGPNIKVKGKDANEKFKGNILKAYPPLLKIKIKISKDDQTDCCTITEFAKRWCKHYHLDEKTYKNKYIINSLVTAAKLRGRFGYSLELVVE